MAAEGHRDASSLHGRLVVPQLVDPLLFQEERLLGGDAHVFCGFTGTSPSEGHGAPQSRSFTHTQRGAPEHAQAASWGQPPDARGAPLQAGLLVEFVVI